MTTVDSEVFVLISQESDRLELLGFTDSQVTAAIRRARKSAEKSAMRVRESLRDEVFIDNLKIELSLCEKWLKGVRESLPEWKEGLTEFGTPPGPESTLAYKLWSA